MSLKEEMLKILIRMDKKHFVVAQVYVDDIVFVSTNDNLAKSFVDEMKKCLR